MTFWLTYKFIDRQIDTDVKIPSTCNYYFQHKHCTIAFLQKYNYRWWVLWGKPRPRILLKNLISWSYFSPIEMKSKHMYYAWLVNGLCYLVVLFWQINISMPILIFFLCAHLALYHDLNMMFYNGCDVMPKIIIYFIIFVKQYIIDSSDPTQNIIF